MNKRITFAVCLAAVLCGRIACCQEKETAESYFKKGAAAGSYEQQIQFFTKALELDPKYDKAYYNRGNAYYHLFQYGKAADDYTKFMALNPKDAGAYNYLGIAYRRLNQYDKAIASYSKAIDLDSKNIVAYNNRGGAYLWAGKPGQAKADFEMVIKLDESSSPPYCNLADYYWAFKKDKKNALANIELCLQKGYSRFENFYDEEEDGHFLKGLTKTTDFKLLLSKYRNMPR